MAASPAVALFWGDDDFLVRQKMEKGGMALIDEGRADAIYDAMGPEFTLLRTDPAVDVSPFRAAAAVRGVPLAVLDVGAPEAGGPYTEKLVLSRPDQHVAWRGDAVPADPLGLIDLVRGARTKSKNGDTGRAWSAMPRD